MDKNICIRLLFEGMDPCAHNSRSNWMYLCWHSIVTRLVCPPRLVLESRVCFFLFNKNIFYVVNILRNNKWCLILFEKNAQHVLTLDYLSWCVGNEGITQTVIFHKFAKRFFWKISYYFCAPGWMVCSTFGAVLLCIGPCRHRTGQAVFWKRTSSLHEIAFWISYMWKKIAFNLADFNLYNAFGWDLGRC